MARKGEIDTLVGYNSEYLAPLNPDITLETNALFIEENSLRLKEFLGFNS